MDADSDGGGRRFSKAPQGNERGAVGSKNPPAFWNPGCFSAQHGSGNPGFVLRPLSPMPLPRRALLTDADVLVAPVIPGGFDAGELVRGVARSWCVLSATRLALL